MTQPTPLPYGLRDVKVATLSATGTRGDLVDLPNSRTLSFTESEEFQQLRGDDKVVASRGSGPVVEWELESGGVPFEAIVVMNGGEIIESGTTPARVRTYRKLATDSRPDFYVEGQSMSESGGDFHCVLYRCKMEGDLTGTAQDGEFWLTGAQGQGYPSLATATLDVVYEWVQNETATEIA